MGPLETANANVKRAIQVIIARLQCHVRQVTMGSHARTRGHQLVQMETVLACADMATKATTVRFLCNVQ